MLDYGIEEVLCKAYQRPLYVIVVPALAELSQLARP
jgi:hypothetical protein